MLRRLAVTSLSCLSLASLACELDERDPDGMGGIVVPPDPVDPPAEDPGVYLEGIEGEFQAAADEFSVPIEVLKAIGYVESQWQMVVGEIEFDGLDPAFGAMALRGDNLTRGAALIKEDVEDVKNDRALNIRAAAALLSELADDHGLNRADIGAWAPAIADLSGIEPESPAAISYIHQNVYALIQNGLVVTDLEGNVISEIKPQGGIVPNYPRPDGPVLATNPDYAGAIWRASPNFSGRPAGSAGTIRLVIIHTCEGAYAGCWGWLVNKQAGVSAHYVVKEDGSEISQLVKESGKAWHISAKYKSSLNGGTFPEVEGAASNNFTVGIEHAGYGSQNSWNANLIDQSAKLVCDITKRQNLPRDKFHIVGHGQLQPYNRSDPGKAWPWGTYFDKIIAACGGPPPDPEPDPQPDPNPDPNPDPPPPDPPPPDPKTDPAELIIDSSNGNNNPANAAFSASASWTATASTPGYYGNNYLYAATEAVSDGAEFKFFLNNAGNKKVEVWYTAGANRAAAAPIVAFDAQGVKLGTGNVNMQQGGKAWTSVGSFNFTAGWNKVVVSRWTTAGSVVIADAVRITAGDGQAPPPPMDPPITDPTHDQLLALTQSCTQLPGTSKFKSDSGGSATIPVCQLSGAVFWKADADIDCDGGKNAACTADPYYQAETSAKDSKGNFVDAGSVPFFVVPLASNGFDPKALGIKTSWSGWGSPGAILYNGKLLYAVYADAGPTDVIGELSYRAAELLGIPSSPINGGVASGVTYIVFTGDQYVNPLESTGAAETLGKQLATQLLQNN